MMTIGYAVMPNDTLAPEPHAGESGAAGARGHLILVVEDHPATRSALTTLLCEAFPGCRVMAAETAERALLICKSEAPGLVLMDIGLPGMNGIEATRIIKQMSGRTRVVMHTTSDMPIYREEAAAAGADAFVGKAKNAADLLSIISSFLR